MELYASFTLAYSKSRILFPLVLHQAPVIQQSQAPFNRTRCCVLACVCRLLKVRLDKEEFEEELKELQGRVSSMKQQIPDPSHAETLSKVPPPC